MENNTWTYTIEDLDKNYQGQEIVYSISEEEEVEGYQSLIEDNKITNTHTPITIDIIGNKVWNDGDNKDGLRPDSITVELYADGMATGITATASASSEWKYTFNGLDQNKNGKKIVYTVKELEFTNMDKYTTTYDDDNPFTIINTHEVIEKEITVTKVWEDLDNKYGHSNTIEVTLNAMIGDEQAFDPITVTFGKEENWAYTFTKLPEYKDGKLITYTISETPVLDYSTKIEGSVEDGFVITNTYTPTTIDIKGIKNWDDSGNQDGIRPKSITVNLLDNNNDIVATTEVSEPNWEFEFKNQVKYSNGEEINYKIQEVDVDGYVTNITNDGLSFEITNTHTPETISYVVTKSWSDFDNNDGIRPKSITVTLLANGVEVQKQEISDDNNWTYTFENLAKYSNGQIIEYQIIEDVVKGYEDIQYTTIIHDDNTTEVVIKNNHELETTEITVNKIWDDMDNCLNTRPESITVNLYNDYNELVATIEITSKMNWTYTFENLLKYKNGKLINYRIEEVKVDGYATTYDNYNIINTYENIGVGQGELEPPKTGNMNNSIYENLIIIITSILLGLVIRRKQTTY